MEGVTVIEGRSDWRSRMGSRWGGTRDPAAAKSVIDGFRLPPSLPDETASREVRLASGTTDNSPSFTAVGRPAGGAGDKAGAATEEVWQATYCDCCLGGGSGGLVMICRAAITASASAAMAAATPSSSVPPRASWALRVSVAAKEAAERKGDEGLL